MRRLLAVWLIFAAAALLEVGGDAVIRRGLRGRQAGWIIAGCAMLAFYGVAVNSIRWDFSEALGLYVGFFAIASVLFGRYFFREAISVTTLCGLVLIILGGIVIQLGR